MTERDDAQLLEAEDSLATLHISKPTTTDEPPEPNPWQDSTHNILEVSVLANNTLEGMKKSSDVSALDPSTAKGLAAELVAVPDEEGESRQEILQEFDPLANHEEKAAKTAWESSDSNPPSIAPVAHPVADAPPPPAPTTHAIDLSHPSSPSLPSFPSLAALARTFALPLTSRQRPRSLDTATAVPSPATLSSFASQQQQQPRAIQPASDSGRSTPTRIGKANDGDPLQFDFQKFLDQMKLKSAEPVAKYLRSFLSNFAKRTFTVNDQVKLINDFLVFISAKMHETDLWRSASDAEFENAMEGMEKLVMNRLYDFTFTPQVIRMIPPRPVTTDDLERDRVLSQRIALFRWIEAKHLDIPEEHGSEGFLMFAQQELLKINHYKAPRDKLICILNCCKVIFGLLSSRLS
ncbi:hypothetical protein EW026_g5143 [Hermanssonia centrifuga]|uniref:VPS9 domain-containing protein n=1 Tax=Hermanssonia centrifuga TaxID=98765 RepID=A0A4S4KGS7_9APHY|nr:hypothetical protein EW026_g5143 [Hermanssonia centrifuga]